MHVQRGAGGTNFLSSDPRKASVSSARHGVVGGSAGELHAWHILTSHDVTREKTKLRRSVEPNPKRDNSTVRRKEIDARLPRVYAAMSPCRSPTFLSA